MTLIDELHGAFLTSGLSNEQLIEMIAVGEEVAFARGDDLFAEGQPADFLWILLDGAIDLLRHANNSHVVLATMTTPGQWAGGLRAWGDATNSAGYRASGRAASDGRAFLLPSVDLARLVGEWFPFGKHMITGIYQTVRIIEANARQRESLVALGTLAAGLAHEINNPAAASLRAVEELSRTCDAMLSSLSTLAGQSISAEQFVGLDRLRRELTARDVPDADAVAMMDREEAIGAWLESHRVSNPWQIAPLFATAGADAAWLNEVETVSGPAALGAALQWAATTLSATALLGELTDTTNRISNLVASVRSYSQIDRAAQQTIDIREGIENTLVMLASKLTHIDVQRDFADGLPPLEAYPAELNQVWTNLVDNAIDAMHGEGTLRVTIRRDADDLIVAFTDSGHGMSDQVQSRAFEPFFTTKDVGKGIGLGLDISRRIVAERHGGDISFQSVPGSTTASVRLPISR